MKSETLARVSKGARLTFIYLFLVSDNSGCFACDRTLLGDLYPLDESVDQYILDGYLCELEMIGSLEFYRNENKIFGFIPTFAKYQTGLKYTDRLLISEVKDDQKIIYREYLENRRSEQSRDSVATQSRPRREPVATSSTDVTGIDLSTVSLNRVEDVSTYKVVPVVGLVDDFEHSVVEPPRRSLGERAAKFFGGGARSANSADSST